MESVRSFATSGASRFFVALVGVVSIAQRVRSPSVSRSRRERRSYTVGVANASVLIDTPKSQVVEVAPKGSDTLGPRANVLANLMVDGEIKNAIAARAGLRAEAAPRRSVATGDPGRQHAARSSYRLTTGVA